MAALEELGSEERYLSVQGWTGNIYDNSSQNAQRNNDMHSTS